MNELHLSESTMTRLLTHVATEEERLSCAAHLSVCDRCLKHYTDLLTDEICLAPAQSLAPQVRNTLVRQTANSFFRRCAAAAAAVLLAMTFWMTDIFSSIVPKTSVPSASVQTHSNQISDQLSGFFCHLSDSLTELTLTHSRPRADANGAETIVKES